VFPGAGKFARTPKPGPRTEGPRYRPRWPWLILVEMLLSALYLYWTWEVARKGEWSRLPLFLLFASSYLGTIAGTVIGHVRWHQGRVDAPAPALASLASAQQQP